MLLDALSRRARRVVQFVNVIDVGGATLAHRKALPYLKEFVGGEATLTNPPLLSVSCMVGMGSLAFSILNVSVRSFLSSAQQEVLRLIRGRDAFAASAEFAVRFEREIAEERRDGVEALEARDTELAERLVREHTLNLAAHVEAHVDYLD